MSGILGLNKLGAFVLGRTSALSLITDRTAADVERAQYLNDLWVAGEFLGTDEEYVEWFSDMKGAYNASDLNRVESAVEYLAKVLRELAAGLKEYAAEKDVGWDVIFAPPFDPANINPETKTDWTEKDLPTPEDMERYLNNVELLRTALAFDTDELPASMDNLSIQGANAIERALKNLDSAIILFRVDMQILIDNTAASWFYSGEIYTGEV